jgi:hypothetical protein
MTRTPEWYRYSAKNPNIKKRKVRMRTAGDGVYAFQMPLPPWGNETQARIEFTDKLYSFRSQ